MAHCDPTPTSQRSAGRWSATAVGERPRPIGPGPQTYIRVEDGSAGPAAGGPPDAPSAPAPPGGCGRDAPRRFRAGATGPPAERSLPLSRPDPDAAPQTDW